MIRPAYCHRSLLEEVGKICKYLCVAQRARPTAMLLCSGSSRCRLPLSLDANEHAAAVHLQLSQANHSISIGYRWRMQMPMLMEAAFHMCESSGPNALIQNMYQVHHKILPSGTSTAFGLQLMFSCTDSRVHKDPVDSKGFCCCPSALRLG